MGIHHATTQHRLITVALAALLVSLVEGRAASADPSASAPATAAATVYNYAPVTFWLVPHLSLGGPPSQRLRTNFALALGHLGLTPPYHQLFVSRCPYTKSNSCSLDLRKSIYEE